MLGNKYADIGIKPWQFKVRDYRMMAKHGFWPREQRVELIAGSLIKLPAPTEEHDQVSARLTALLSRGSGKPWQVRVGKALQLSDLSEFLPDLTLLKRRNYGSAVPTPTDALVAIEIGDERTLESDREVKVPLYAAAGIPELWLVELRHRWIARYHQRIGDEYGQMYTFREHTMITSAVLPTLTLPVAAIVGAPSISAGGKQR